jgi:hypothetical protein
MMTCRNCGVEFSTADHRRRYCSPGCRCQAQIDRQRGGTMTAALEVRQWEGHAIQRRTSDGFVNATAMCQANGKKWNDYARLNRTHAYIAALAAVAGNPATENHGLIHVIQGGPPHLQGTWIHPRLAVDLARWCRPAFAVWMDGWLLEQFGTHDPAPNRRHQLTEDELLFGRHTAESWNQLHETERQAHGLLWSIHLQQRDGATASNTSAILRLASGILAHYVQEVGGLSAACQAP